MNEDTRAAVAKTLRGLADRVEEGGCLSISWDGLSKDVRVVNIECSRCGRQPCTPDEAICDACLDDVMSE